MKNVDCWREKIQQFISCICRYENK